MIRMRPATPEDFNAAVRQAIPEAYDQSTILQNGLPPGAAFSLWYDEHLLAVIGTQHIWGGVVAVWAILTVEIYRYRVSLLRVLKQLLSFNMIDLNLHRVQIDVRADYAAGHRFAKALGFIAEGTMKKFGTNKEDYVLYARVL